MNREEQIDRSLEGLLSAQEWAELRREIVSDPETRQIYAERRWLHAELRAAGGALPSLLAEPAAAESHGSAAGAPARTPFAAALLRRGGWAAAAALLVLVASLHFLAPRPEPFRDVAVLVEAEGCRWDGSELPTREGALLGRGTLALAEGMATIRFHSGATVTLEAPTVLEIESAMRCRLVEGSVVADVPESAHGFTIDAEGMEVIDLGTRFGVTATPVGGSHVFVFEGEVKVIREEDPEPRHILPGRSLHLGAAPGLPDQEVARSAPLALPRGNWHPVSTAAGRGRDAYIRRGDSHGPTGGHPLLMVKHTDIAENNVRRALLSFDLSARGVPSPEAVKLTLKVEASGLGFSSLVPDSRFAVHGVLDPAYEEWEESALLWAGAGSIAEDEIDPALFPRLAEFEIPKGASHHIVEVSSDALRDYVAGREGALASFLIVRETGEYDRQGLVHAFASKEHPTSPPPTLWLRAASPQ